VRRAASRRASHWMARGRGTLAGYVGSPAGAGEVASPSWPAERGAGAGDVRVRLCGRCVSVVCLVDCAGKEIRVLICKMTTSDTFSGPEGVSFFCSN
jgi:hypothetical protein